MLEVTRVNYNKNSKLYNIYLDGNFAFSVGEKILIKFNLFKGIKIDNDISNIIESEYNQEVYQKALTYASRSLHSKKQVQNKLQKEDFSKLAISKAIEQLEYLGIIDDSKFANEYVQEQMQRGKLGPQMVKLNLKKYGIDSLIIEEMLIQYDEEIQRKNLYKLIEPLFDKYFKESSFMADKKVAQKLYKNGFDQNEIRNAIKNYHLKMPVNIEQQQENFNRMIEKIVKKYEYLTGLDYENKVKAGMYRRGYDLRQVDQWLKEHQNN